MQEEKHYFSVFYSRRALRILPPNFLFLFIYLGYSLVVGRAGKAEYWTQYIFYYTSLFPHADRFTVFPDIFPVFVLSGLGVMWSLSVEEIYYTIWAPVVRYASKRIFLVILGVMILVPPVLRWIAPVTEFHNFEIYTFYCRMDALAYGSVVAVLVAWRAKNHVEWAKADRVFDAATLVTGVFTIGLWVAKSGNQSSFTLRTVGLVLADLSFALVIYALIRRTGSTSWYVRIFRWKPLRSIGMVSYSLYLCHYPCYVLATQLVAEWHLSRRWNVFAAASLGLMASFALAYALWYGMESRILRWKDKKVPSLGHVKKEAV